MLLMGACHEAMKYTCPRSDARTPGDGGAWPTAARGSTCHRLHPPAPQSGAEYNTSTDWLSGGGGGAAWV